MPHDYPQVLSRPKACADFLSIFSNSKRLEILTILRDGEITVTALAQRVGMQQSALSQHLSLLRNAGLVEVRRDSQRQLYSTTSSRVGRMLDVLAEIFGVEAG